MRFPVREPRYAGDFNCRGGPGKREKVTLGCNTDTRGPIPPSSRDEGRRGYYTAGDVDTFMAAFFILFCQDEAGATSGRSRAVKCLRPPPRVPLLEAFLSRDCEGDREQGQQRARPRKMRTENPPDPAMRGSASEVGGSEEGWGPARRQGNPCLVSLRERHFRRSSRTSPPRSCYEIGDVARDERRSCASSRPRSTRNIPESAESISA